MLKGIYRFKSTPMKIPMAFFTEQGHIIKICVETQKVFNSQNDLEKEEQSWRNHTLWCQTILQSYSNQNSAILAQKKISEAEDRPEIIPHT